MNKAQEIIIPPAGVLRFVFLYTGQGDSTVVAVPDGSSFKFILIDNNIDKSAGGINTTKLLTDLLDEDLDVFINTHPHSDHTEGVEEINTEVGIKEVWHSGHKPGKKHDDAYQELRRVIKAIGSENEYKLFGTNSLNKIRKADGDTEVTKKLGDVDYQVLSPAEYLCEEIENEDADTRYRRIHEQCAVIRFSYGSPQRHVLMTGDADRKAWENHILDYHRENVQAEVLSAVHHGSRTFFKYPGNDDDVYEEHINEIKPQCLIVSAPTQKESKHDHPHDDAMKIYKKHVDEENIFHLGKNRESVIVDVYPNGEYEVSWDKELVKAYGYDSNDGGGKKNENKSAAIVGGSTRLDNKPMG